MAKRLDAREQRFVQEYLIDLDPKRAALAAAGVADVAPGGVLRARFVLPMPASWSKRRKAATIGAPHASRPDLDNLVKALQDAALDNDQHVWLLAAEKVWGERGRIELLDDNPW